MDTGVLLHLLFNAALSLIISLAVIAYLRAAAQSALEGLCPATGGVRFWVRLLDVNICLVPLLLVALFDPERPNSALALVLSGIIAVLFVTGRRVRQAIQEEQKKNTLAASLIPTTRSPS